MLNGKPRSLREKVSFCSGSEDRDKGVSSSGSSINKINANQPTTTTMRYYFLVSSHDRDTWIIPHEILSFILVATKFLLHCRLSKKKKKKIIISKARCHSISRALELLFVTAVSFVQLSSSHHPSPSSLNYENVKKMQRFVVAKKAKISSTLPNLQPTQPQCTTPYPPNTLQTPIQT